MSNPTIILVPGAWHGADITYAPVMEILTKQSYPCVAITTPTVGAEPPNKSFTDDVKAIHDVMLPLLDQGKEVVLVAHSYGGIPTTISTKGHSIEERKKQGKVGGIKAVAYLTALVITTPGANVFEHSGGVWPPWLTIDGNYTTCGPGAEDAFYNDIQKEKSQVLMKSLTHHCLPSLLERPDFVGTDLKVPSAYLVCKGDHCVPIPAQEATIAGVPGMKRFECEGGHSSMLSMPDVVADYIVKVATGA